MLGIITLCDTLKLSTYKNTQRDNNHSKSESRSAEKNLRTGSSDQGKEREPETQETKTITL